MKSELRRLREVARIDKNIPEYRRLTAKIRYEEKKGDCLVKMAEYRARLTPEQKRAQYLYAKEGIESDPEKLARRREQAKKWRLANPEKFKASVKKCRQNPYYTIKRGWDLRAIAYATDFQTSKGAPRKHDYQGVFGCTHEEFKAHMGPKPEGWTLDHIIPCCRFDILTDSGLKQAYHYTNLRWLPSRANQIKAAK